LETASFDSLKPALAAAFSPHAVIRLGHPFGEVIGHDAFFDRAFAPLFGPRYRTLSAAI